MSASGDGDTKKVEENCDEYNQISHYLAMCTQKTGTVSNLDVWKIVNGETAYKFDRRTGGMLRLPCWSETSCLPDGDCLDSVCSRGFRFQGQSGFSFHSGMNDFGVSSKDGPQSCQALYCEVAVGRAQVTDADPTTTRIPSGFDSLYVCKQPLDRNQDGEFSIGEYQTAANFDYRDPTEYSHDYFVCDPLLVNPKYIVNFTLTPHSTAAPVTLAASTAGSAEVFEYFDPVQYRPVSTAEKQSNAQLARRLVTIQQAYQFAAEEAKKEDSLLSSKVTWIDHQLAEVDERVRAVAVNYAEAHEQITRAAEDAVRRLQKLTREKMELLLSSEVELRREREEIEWAERHIAVKLKASSGVGSAGPRAKENRAVPVGAAAMLQQQLQFLLAWKSHAVLRNGLSRLRPVENNVTETVLPDITVAASISVESTSCSPQQKPFTGSSPLRMLQSSASGMATQSKPEDGGGCLDQRATSPPGPTDASKSFELSQFLHSAKGAALYSEPPSRPAEILVSPSTQALVDVNLSKIELALTAALEEGSGLGSTRRAVPLPISITRPTLSGASYHLPGSSVYPSAESNSRRLRVVSEGGSEAWLSEENMKLELQREIRSVVSSSEGNAVSSRGHAAVQHRDKRLSAAQNSLLSGQSKQMFSPSASGRGLETMSAMSGGSRRVDREDATDRSAIAEMSDSPAKVELLQSRTATFRGQYALTVGAQRRQKQMAASTFKISEKNVFFGSTILDPIEAQNLYFNVPFFSRPHQCRLIYSTEKHARGLAQLLKACSEIDGAPVMIVIQSGLFKLGCYLNQAPVPSGAWAGSPACFLFSNTLDLKLPYHGRKPPNRGRTDFPCAFLADLDHLEVGNGDLYLDATLAYGYSELEGCYGVGMPIGGEEASCLLAGRHNFPVDIVELWLIAAPSNSL